MGKAERSQFAGNVQVCVGECRPEFMAKSSKYYYFVVSTSANNPSMNCWSICHDLNHICIIKSLCHFRVESAWIWLVSLIKSEHYGLVALLMYLVISPTTWPHQMFGQHPERLAIKLAIYYCCCARFSSHRIMPLFAQALLCEFYIPFGSWIIKTIDE